MSRTIWGYWDCKFCSNKKIRGDKDECPSCGHPRSADVKFYIDRSNIEYVSTDAVNEDPNWICSYCDTQNENIEDVCEYCGASKTESETNYFEKHKKSEKTECTSDFTRNACFDSPHVSTPTANKVHRKVNIKPFLQYGCIAIAVSLLVIFLIWFLTPVEHEANVTEFEWNRCITIERLTTFDESGWTLPANARLQRTAEEIRSYEKVIDHYETKTRQVAHDEIVDYEEYVVGYEDLGNGQFRERTATRPIYETYYETEIYQEPVYRDEPVYDTKYYYEIDRYVYSHSIKTGDINHEPYWGTVILNNNEREGNRTETYWITCNEYRTTLEYSDWSTYNIGDAVIVTTNRTGDVIYSITPL